MTDDSVDVDGAARPAGRLGRGSAVIEAQVRTLPGSPGVYRMLGASGDVLYVGKAKNLKKRVAAYTRLRQLPDRLRRMVAQTADMEIVTTHTEAEALLLESNLVKRFKPPFNILLKDDKAFPHILITDHAWPRITKHRGARRTPGRYYGPFASVGAVNHTLSLLQKAFLLRSCTDAVFDNRSRPCLLYQIRRCAAPCVDRVDAETYAGLVRDAEAFLSGRSQAIQNDLSRRMEEAAEALNFEDAAVYRDRIQALSRVQAEQDIALPGMEDCDVIAVHQQAGETCIQVFFFRAGCNYGNRAFYPAHEKNEGAGAVLEAFLGQFYAERGPPPLVLLSHAPNHQDTLAEALSVQADRRVRLTVPRRGDRRKLVEHGLTNAREALGRRLAETGAQRRLLDGLAETLGLDRRLDRVEVYDNSHVQGSHPVGAMIVAGPEGFEKKQYRRFNIRAEDGARPDDDYAMMRQVFGRRFSRARKEDPDGERGHWPDLVLIDGGRGQLNAARAVLAELGVAEVPLAAVAKGPQRNAGREVIHLPDDEIRLPERDPVLYFVQRLRDEAHRFAVGSHRGRRHKAMGESPLDDLQGVGPKRKKNLLHHFGSARAVAEAGVADLEKVAGISRGMARKIYDHFHPDG